MHHRISTLLVAATVALAAAAPAAAETPNESSSALVAAVPISAPNAKGDTPATDRKYPLDVALTLNPTVGNLITSNSFFMMGGGIQFHGSFSRNWGAVADVAGMGTSNAHASGAGVNLITASFGPRYTWCPAHKKYSLYGQGLAGIANGFSGVYPTINGATTSANSFAALAGGGVNYAISPRISIRIAELDWLLTHLPNSTTNVQNNLRIGTGVSIHFR